MYIFVAPTLAVPPSVPPSEASHFSGTTKTNGLPNHNFHNNLG